MPLPINLRRAEQLIALTFNATATIMRKGQVADSSGGTTDTYSAVATLPCNFTRSNVTPREHENAYTIQHISYWTFVFAARSDVRTTDRIVSQGRTWEVVGGGSGSYEIATRVTCQEIY